MREFWDEYSGLILPIVVSAIFSFLFLAFVYTISSNSGNDGNNNHYAQKDTIMIENTDTLHNAIYTETIDTLYDTIYIQVPDQNAYNIGYFDGNFDAQNGNIIGVDND